MNNSQLWAEYKKSPTVQLKKQITIKYVNLVHYVVHNSKFGNYNILDERDYFQYGIEGLSEAIDRFDPDYGTKFETYAIQRIRGKILDELRKIQLKPRQDGTTPHNESFYSTVSLNRSSDDEDGYTLGEVIPSDIETPAMVTEKNEAKTLLVNAIKQLDERERLILSLYYYEDLSYKEIAQLMNITISRVSQVHTKVINRLKAKLTVLND
ncbi:MAG TPA: sigma-70 family RNA polymerase sigma factor [Ignavibacteriaceae bacterium]|nr:sigma-70 family RNA polymerase sigma factor [Ignavibacteriaceae bacterium]